MTQLSRGWNSATRPLLIGREDMNHTMRATSQDEFGGPEVLGRSMPHAQVSAGPMQKVEGSNPFSRFPERST